MDIQTAVSVLEKALPEDFDEDTKIRLAQLVRIEDPIGTLPTPCGPRVACTICRHPLTIAPALKKDIATSSSSSKERKKSVAYTTLLYGDNVAYLLGTLVLGQNLKKYSTHDRVLMYTFDVPQIFLDVLSTYWILRKVDYIYGSRWLFYDYEGSRFHKVFTKLRVFSLTEYSKVLMLDNDMLIRQSIEDLFELEAPAAMRRHGGSAQPAHGERFLADECWRGPWETGGTQNLGINAGTMLLEPDEYVHKRMMEEVEMNHIEHQGTYGPEQDYISRFYTTFGRTGGIAHIGCEYNYQLLLDNDYTSNHYKSLEKKDIKICHFSGNASKPWHLDTPVIMSDDGLIKEKYYLKAPNSGDIWSDMTWEWVFSCRESAKDVEKKTGKALEELVSRHNCLIEAEKQRMNTAEALTQKQRTTLEDELGEWTPSKWTTWSQNKSGWIEFRPKGVLWSDKGLGRWEILDDKMYLAGAYNLCLKMGSPSQKEREKGTKKKLRGQGFQAWPGDGRDSKNDDSKRFEKWERSSGDQSLLPFMTKKKHIMMLLAASIALFLNRHPQLISWLGRFF